MTLVEAQKLNAGAAGVSLATGRLLREPALVLRVGFKGLYVPVRVRATGYL